MPETTEQSLNAAAATSAAAKSASPMRPLLSLPVPQAAAIVAAMQLDKAHEAYLRLTRNPDTEALHDFRVGLRQLRSTFSAYPEAFPSLPKRLRKYMRQLARDTSHARDAEVQLDWLERNERQVTGDARLGLRWMLRQLELLLQQRPEYQDAQLLRGHIELARGNAQAARSAWQQVRHGPAATQARALLDSLEEAGPSPRGGDASGPAGRRWT